VIFAPYLSQRDLPAPWIDQVSAPQPGVDVVRISFGVATSGQRRVSLPSVGTSVANAPGHSLPSRRTLFSSDVALPLFDPGRDVESVEA
jgi:hypothetical protein